MKGFGFIFYLCWGDGCVVFGLMLCEYIISEVMYVFDILIICSLVVVIIGELIYCEIKLFGVILIRVVSSYICVGIF